MSGFGQVQCVCLGRPCFCFRLARHDFKQVQTMIMKRSASVQELLRVFAKSVLGFLGSCFRVVQLFLSQTPDLRIAFATNLQTLNGVVCYILNLVTTSRRIWFRCLFVFVAFLQNLNRLELYDCQLISRGGIRRLQVCFGHRFIVITDIRQNVIGCKHRCGCVWIARNRVRKSSESFGHFRNCSSKSASAHLGIRG